MGTKEFIHSRIVVNATEASRLSSETSSNVNLQVKSALLRAVAVVMLRTMENMLRA